MKVGLDRRVPQHRPAGAVPYEAVLYASESVSKRTRRCPGPRTFDKSASEAAFKTPKYAPVFPDRFGSLADARTFCAAFFDYYNHEHRHSGSGWHPPASVHHGTCTRKSTRPAIKELRDL
jgi:transposase InsO family protein